MSKKANDDNIETEPTAGETLRIQREKLSMSLDDISSKTRVTLRHLEAIEKSQYHKLPGKTYIIGFAKAYARSMDLSEVEIAAQLREELSQSEHEKISRHIETYEPAASVSIPPKTLAWAVAFIVIFILLIFLIWRNGQSGTSNPAPDTDIINASESEINQADANSAKPIAVGKVIMSATDEVWLQITDSDKKSIYENVMKAGDTYEIPADANNPVILTGRPDVLNFTVGGKAIKPLGDGKTTIKDVGVSAQALIQHHQSAGKDLVKDNTDSN